MSTEQPDLPLPPHGRPPITHEPGTLTCRACHTPTSAETLALLGARCEPCYAQSIARIPASPDVGDKRIDRLGWAHALKRRDDAGERLTPAQRNAYRDALRHPFTSEDA